MKMAGNSCLLDTNIIVNCLRNEQSTIEKLNAFSEIFIPSITVGELYFGAYHSANPAKHLLQLEQFLPNQTILLPDTLTADLYGNIKADLRRIGKPIPENDIWIA